MINKYKFYKGYYFSIAAISLVIFTVIVTPAMVRVNYIFQLIYFILLILSVSIFPLIFIYMAIKLKGKERLMAIKILFALLLLFIGFIAVPQNIVVVESELPNYLLIYTTFLILSPILITAAILLMYDSYRQNLKPD